MLRSLSPASKFDLFAFFLFFCIFCFFFFFLFSLPRPVVCLFRLFLSCIPPVSLPLPYTTIAYFPTLPLLFFIFYFYYLFIYFYNLYVYIFILYFVFSYSVKKTFRTRGACGTPCAGRGHEHESCSPEIDSHHQLQIFHTTINNTKNYWK